MHHELNAVARRMGSVIVLCCIGAVVAQPVRAAQPAYPSRPIRMIVPTTAGGTTDVLARMVADGVRDRLGQAVIIENRPGAGGLIAARAAAAAEADGYTVLFGNTATFATLPAVIARPGYDPVASFVPIAKVMESYQVLVVGTAFPARTTGELIAYAKANPGQLNFGTGGPGNITHLSGELLEARAGIDVVPVHFRSGSDSITALLAGDVQLTIDNITAVRAWIDEGKLRPLAVTSAVREPGLPGVPTMAEGGVPDYLVTSFFGVVAPRGTPEEIQRRLSDAISAVLGARSFQDSLAKLGGRVSAGSPRDFGQQIADESRKWVAIARNANIRLNN